MQTRLKGLEAVLAIARKGSFRAAALDLGLSTTALSHTIGGWRPVSACGSSTAPPAAWR